MRTFTLLTAAALLPFSSFAGTATVASSGKDKVIQPECAVVPLDSLSVTTDYGFHQDMKRGSGNLEVEHNNVEFDRLIPLNLFSWPNQQCGQWFLQLGANYERFDFSIHNESRLPTTLQSASGVIGLEYLVNGHSAILLQTRPGVYFERKINSGSFDAPTDLVVAIPIKDDKVYLIAGAVYSSLDRYPVLPIGGILWHINDKWDLRGYLPNPRLVYQFSDNIEVYAGGELVGGSYKTDNRQISPAKLSGGVITYEEARAGAGISWKAKPLTLDFGAGYTVQSSFDYNRAGESFGTHPAPYVRLTAQVSF